MKLTLQEAMRAVLNGSDGTGPGWNPYELGKRANKALLFFFKICCVAGFSTESAWAMTEKVASFFVWLRSLCTAKKGERAA